MNKKLRLTKKMRKTNRKKRCVIKPKVGGCGCNLIKGGNINPPSFDGSLPIRYFYGANDHVNDSSDPSVVINARNLPNPSYGGSKLKKSKTIKRRKLRKLLKGGDILMGSTYSNNPMMTSMTTDGAQHAVNILYGTPPVNPISYDQPVLNGFSTHNPPLA